MTPSQDAVLVGQGSMASTQHIPPPQTNICIGPYQPGTTLDQGNSTPTSASVNAIGTTNSTPEMGNAGASPQRKLGRAKKDRSTPTSRKENVPESKAGEANFIPYMSPFQNSSSSEAPPQFQPHAPILPPKYQSASRQQGMHLSNKRKPAAEQRNVLPDQPVRPPPDYTQWHGNKKPETDTFQVGTSNESLNHPNIQWRPDPRDPRVLIPAQVPVETPPTKEAMSRKRNILELLEEHSEALEEPTASKVRRVGETLGEFGERKRTDQTRLESPHSQPPSRLPHSPNQLAALTSFPNSEVGFHESASYKEPNANPFKDFKDVVKPINKAIALRKAKHDGKTIASHVLIATSRHLTQRGLNAHLEPLKAIFSKVDNSSDLSTFRWDLVDPGGIAVGSAKFPITQIENSKAADMDSISADVPDRSVPSRRGQAPPTRGGSYIGTSTRGKRRGRPPGSKIVNGKLTLSGLRNEVTTVDSDDDAVKVDSKESEMDISHPAPTGSVQHSNGHQEGPRKPGRPKKYLVDSAHSSPAPSQTGTLADNFTVASSTTKRRGRPPRDSVVPPSSVTASNATPTVKRRGRPPKSSIHAAGAVDSVSPAPALTTMPKHRGRPRKYPLEDRLARIPVREPQFVSFFCEWEGCEAELQNLETLKLHLLKAHGNNAKKLTETGAIQCKWAKCCLDQYPYPGSSSWSPSVQTHYNRLQFPDLAAYEKHIQIAHLDKISWHLGDGPRGSTLDPSEPDYSYLFDSQGRQVTPSVNGQSISSENVRDLNQRREEEMIKNVSIVERSVFTPYGETIKHTLFGEEGVCREVPWNDPIEILFRHAVEERERAAKENYKDAEMTEPGDEAESEAFANDEMEEDNEDISVEGGEEHDGLEDDEEDEEDDEEDNEEISEAAQNLAAKARAWNDLDD